MPYDQPRRKTWAAPRRGWPRATKHKLQPGAEAPTSNHNQTTKPLFCHSCDLILNTDQKATHWKRRLLPSLRSFAKLVNIFRVREGGWKIGRSTPSRFFFQCLLACLRKRPSRFWREFRSSSRIPHAYDFSSSACWPGRRDFGAQRLQQ